MNSDQIKVFKEEITTHLEDVVRRTVNGKIDTLSKKLDRYIEDDTSWKIQAKPVIDMGINMSGFGKVIAYIVGVLAGIGGAYEGVRGVISFFRK